MTGALTYDEPPPIIRTASEQRLAWLESVHRPLTDEESDLLRRSLHAVYCHNRRLRIEQKANAPILAQLRREELKTLAKVEAEMRR